MSEKRSIENLIKGQLTIFKNNGMENQTVTISVPKITQDKRGEFPEIEITSLIEVLIDILGYEPEILSSQILYSDKMATIILTFIFLGFKK